MIKILIADDHAVVREGVKRILADTDDIVVVGEVGTPAELLAAAVTGQSDVILMDLAMPGTSGLELLHDLRRQVPKLPVLVLSMYPEEQYAVRALIAGASGYINKGSPPAELIHAIRTVAAGHRYITTLVANSLASHVQLSSSKRHSRTVSTRCSA
jgi:two-component system invasion response regulator UvrY